MSARCTSFAEDHVRDDIDCLSLLNSFGDRSKMLSSKSLRKYMASVSEVALLTTGSEAEKGKHSRSISTVGKW